MNLDPSAMAELHKVYPATARVLEKAIALFERLPSDADRVRWRDFLGEFVTTFAEEEQQRQLASTRTTVLDAYSGKQ